MGCGLVVPVLKPNPTSTGVTPRAIIISVILLPPNFYWLIVGEMEMGGGSYMLPTFIVPLYNVIFCLFTLTLLNSLIKKVFGCTGLHPSELLSVYVLLSSACSLCSINMMGFLFTSLGHSTWFATPENEWHSLFSSFLPTWLVVTDEQSLTGYYQGNSTLYTRQHLGSWILPTLIWTGFMSALSTMMLCLNLILRQQWSEKEKLSYPIIQLPVSMVSNINRFFSSKPMWFGFSIASVITFVNGISFLYPDFPSVPVSRQSLLHLFPDKPWSAIGRGGFNLSLYPFALGLSFLMPLDLTFSCWFFYLIGKLELVLGSMTGWISLPGYPHSAERAFGATIAFLLLIVWVGRVHLKTVLFKVWQASGKMPDANTYRWAILGLIASGGSLLLFSTYLGLSLWLAVLFFAIYLLLSILVARMRAELGFFTHPMWGIMAPDMLISLTGSRALGPKNLTILALYRWFNFGFSSHQMPHQLEALKIVDRTGMDRRKVAYSLIFITALGGILLAWVYLHIFYRVGALNGGGWATGGGNHTFNSLQNWIVYPQEQDLLSIIFMGFGLGVSMFLSIMRVRLIWWGFHPIGYIVANLEWAMRNFWSCMLISSSLKWLVLKYSGPSQYQAGLQLCLGLVLGDFITGSLWNVIGVGCNFRTYSFWPGAYLP